MCIFIVRAVKAREETESGVADNSSLWQIAENGALFLLVKMGIIINQNRIFFFSRARRCVLTIIGENEKYNDFGWYIISVSFKHSTLGTNKCV